MRRIVITELMDERAVAQLVAKHDVLYDPKPVDDAPRLKAQAANADAIIVRNRTQVRGELLAALARCTVVGRLGVGLDHIDVACEARGIKVIPATGANALSVAEYVVAGARLLLRGAYRATPEGIAGQWPRNALSNGREIGGKTLGLVGFGSIGQLTARLARGMRMTLIAFDSMLDASNPVFAQTGVRCVGLDTLTANADVISLHVPLVDEAAVAQALRSGHLGGAALDEFDAEPVPAGSVFAGCPNLLLTPRIAGVSAESNERVSFLIATMVLEAVG